MDKATHLARLQSVTPRVIEQADMAGTVDQAIEMVGPDTVLVLVCRQAETTAQVVRDKRIGRFLQREDSLIHGKNDQTVEIERTRFQHTHNLQSGKRFTVERNRNRIRHPLQQTEIGVDLHFDVGLLHDFLHSVDCRKVVEDKLLLHVFN